MRAMRIKHVEVYTCANVWTREKCVCKLCQITSWCLVSFGAGVVLTASKDGYTARCHGRMSVRVHKFFVHVRSVISTPEPVIRKLVQKESLKFCLIPEIQGRRQGWA